MQEQTRLAELITESSASVDEVAFTNSGTEATMNAIRAARAFTGKNGVAPTSDEAETSLNVMLNTVKDGRPLGHFVAFDRAGERVNFG